jgi:hypothetical protein
MNWFKRKGIFFQPASAIGWLILILAVVYATYLFIDIDSHSHSVSDTLINFVFNLLIIGIIYSAIGFLTSKRPKK